MGRRLFVALGPLIDWISAVMMIMPEPLFSFCWAAVRNLPGLPGLGLRYLVARRLANSMGRNVRIGPGCTILNWKNISCGQDVSIHTGSYLDGLGGIEIGDSVSIAHGSSLVAFEHTWQDLTVPIKYNPLSECPIVIEDDVWVGCGVRILGGSIVRSRSVVAAGAVLPSGDYQSGKHVGVPAKSIPW